MDNNDKFQTNFKHFFAFDEFFMNTNISTVSQRDKEYFEAMFEPSDYEKMVLGINL